MRALEKGIYLIIFCLPLYLVRFTILNIPTNILEIMVGIFFIIWVINKIKNQKSDLKIKIKNLKIDLNLLIPIALILIGVTITTIYSWDLRISAGIWKSWFIIPIIFFIIFITTINNLEQVKKVFYSFILSGVVVSLISLIYLIQGNLADQSRLQGIFTSPNYLAMYLAPALILSIGLFFKDKKNNLYLVSCFLFLTILFCTKSVGALLGIIGALVFGLVLYLWKKDKKILVFIILFLALLTALGLVYVKTITDKGKLSFNTRLEIWDKAWWVFKTYPITGIGSGTFGDYFPAYPKWGVPQPHNVCLAFLIQTGIIGFIGFIWLLIQFFRNGFKVYGSKLTVLLMMVMVYILIHGLVDTTYWKNDLAVVFWTITGSMAVLKNPR